MTWERLLAFALANCLATACGGDVNNSAEPAEPEPARIRCDEREGPVAEGADPPPEGDVFVCYPEWTCFYFGGDDHWQCTAPDEFPP
jgi:hypothetical protein